MLIEFKVRNFRSFRDEQTLSFVASADRSHEKTHCLQTAHKAVPRVTRAAVIYGANASGKSNLLFALMTMRHLVLQSTAMSEAQYAEQYTPFRLDSATANEPTEFEVTLVVNDVRYQYGFSYDIHRIRGEWLLVYKTGKAQRWFERHAKANSTSEKWEPFSAYFTGPRETWRKATRPQALFLTTAAQLNSDQLRPLMDWFTSGVITLAGSVGPNLAPTLLRFEEPGFKERVLELLRAADLHIADIQVKKRKAQQFQFKLEPGKAPEFAAQDGELPDVEFCHQTEGGTPVWFDRRFESAGTQRLLSYIGPLLDAVEHGKLLVIDELDSSLHPMVMRFLIRLIHDPTFSRKGAQLWITTHDTSLLDVDLLRRDQIWFIEKNEQQASQLYPLSDFSPRKNEALESAYLKGRYGAVPFLSRPELHLAS